MNETNWTKEKIVSRIQELSEDGFAPSISRDSKLYNVARREFGSWAQACREAGVRPRSADRTQWDRETVITKLKEHAEDGYAPSQENLPGLSYAANKIFGSWKTACEEAGLRTAREKRKSFPDSDEDLLDEIRERAEDGVAPRMVDFPYVYEAKKRFGKWSNACHEAGLQTLQESREWTEEKLISIIQEDAEDGIAPSTSDVSYIASVYNYFDSWTEACHQAGVKTKKEMNTWSKERVVKEIRNHSSDGVAPSTNKEMELYRKARRKFDSWQEACEAAGVEAMQYRSVGSNRWNRDKIIRKIKEQSENGVAPKTSPDSNLYKAARRYFDSWQDACKKAGVMTVKEAEETSSDSE